MISLTLLILEVSSQKSHLSFHEDMDPELLNKLKTSGIMHDFT